MKKDIIRKLKDSNKWPLFDRPNFLRELNYIADMAFEEKTVEGYLASFLIYDQLCEEMLRLLLDCCVFFIQCRVFPLEMKRKIFNHKTFGQLIDELEKTISFKNKRELISKCKNLNELRRRIVHGLTRKTSLEDIKKQCGKTKNIYDKIYKLFDDAYDNFRAIFHDIGKDLD